MIAGPAASDLLLKFAMIAGPAVSDRRLDARLRVALTVDVLIAR
jgi:hypothetical protein